MDDIITKIPDKKARLLIREMDLTGQALSGLIDDYGHRAHDHPVFDDISGSHDAAIRGYAEYVDLRKSLEDAAA